jgi:hypothetical protein
MVPGAVTIDGVTQATNPNQSRNRRQDRPRVREGVVLGFSRARIRVCD